MEKNPYLVLELIESDNITKEDIKKAYKRLILKHQPDKNKDIDTTDKFKEIQIAYEILSNDDKKKEFENLSSQEKIKYYDTLKSLITKKYPKINDYLNFIIENVYDSNEINLKKDLEDLNFNSIYNNFINKMSHVLEKMPTQNKTHKSYVIDINIKGKIKADLEDIYLNNFESLMIDRETKDSLNIFVPLIENFYILKNEGEIGMNGIHGDIIIEIESDNSYENFTKIDKDLYVELQIPLYNYLYGGTIKFVNLDRTEFILDHDSLLSNNIIKIPEKGFITDCEKRGYMYLICNIKDLDKNKEKIKKDFSD
jgi:DnaJ-class molecular chaperone